MMSVGDVLEPGPAGNVPSKPVTHNYASISHSDQVANTHIMLD